MKILTQKIIMNIFGVLVGLSGVILIKLIPSWQSEILNIEIIALPSIYIIGNMIIEEKIKKTYEDTLDEISQEAYKLEKKYILERCKNNNKNG